MRVLLSASQGPCGIAEHSTYLHEAVNASDPRIAMRWVGLDPDEVFRQFVGVGRGSDLTRNLRMEEAAILHLNYHAALHSRWTPDRVRQAHAEGLKVIVTYHDTGVPNSQQCRALHAVADAFVVHEPCEDLPGAIYWRQGIPALPYATRDLVGHRVSPLPVVGTVGFPFAWKGFDLLCEASRAAGWGVRLIAPGATQEHMDRWRALNPDAAIKAEFVERGDVVARLHQCHATAFLYNAPHTGTSGAIRQGIAARKPVIASTFPAGRQFRDLQEDDLGKRVITWVEPNLENVVDALSRVRIAPIDAGMVALAARDSWARVGEKYAQLYTELVSK